jgi:hypothetical protein
MEYARNNAIRICLEGNECLVRGMQLHGGITVVTEEGVNCNRRAGMSIGIRSTSLATSRVSYRPGCREHRFVLSIGRESREKVNTLLRTELSTALTKGRYRSMALRKRALYCLGVTIVGSRPPPPKKADSLIRFSSFLSNV